jgi:hypothetical protein
LILAIHPTEPELPYFERMPPLGMLWIGGALRRAGRGVEFLDMQVDPRHLLPRARRGPGQP